MISLGQKVMEAETPKLSPFARRSTGLGWQSFLRRLNAKWINLVNTISTAASQLEDRIRADSRADEMNRSPRRCQCKEPRLRPSAPALWPGPMRMRIRYTSSGQGLPLVPASPRPNPAISFRSKHVDRADARLVVYARTRCEVAPVPPCESFAAHRFRVQPRPQLETKRRNTYYNNNLDRFLQRRDRALLTSRAKVSTSTR